MDGSGKDLPAGEQLVMLFRSFLEHLGSIESIAKNDPEIRSQHLALGGEFIRDFHDHVSVRKRRVEQVLSKMIEYAGPRLYRGGEDRQRSFVATYRKLRRFLLETAR